MGASLNSRASPEVALFVTCLTDTFFARVGECSVRALRHYGCRVTFPREQTCCGQPAFNSGHHDTARALALRMLDIFEPYEFVVSPSASCVAMVRHFPELLADRPGEQAAAQRLAEKTHEFCAFLTEVLRIDLASVLRLQTSTTLHFPCHARELQSPQSLDGVLRRCGPQQYRPAQQPTLCCGFGGLFATEFPEISAAMMRDKLKDLSATQAEQVICNEAGCGLHLMGGARRGGIPLQFKHLAECLAESLGLMETQ